MFSDASVGSAASPTPLFDRQQRKRVAFIGTVLEAGRMPVLDVGHGSVLPSTALRDLPRQRLGRLTVAPPLCVLHSGRYCGGCSAGENRTQQPSAKRQVASSNFGA
ncbi:hypothetical protein MRX96_019121 [Rhipicephalus microplus]